MRFLASTLILAVCFFGMGRTASQTTPCETPKQPHSHTPAMHFNSIEMAPFHFEVDVDRKQGPLTILTNLHSSPLTAYVEEITPVQSRPQHIRRGFGVVDALTRTELLSPIPRGLSFLGSVSHISGEPYPQVNVVAAVWEDGSTYGPDDLIEQIIARRRVSAEEHQHALNLLQKGLKQGWSTTQFLSAANTQKADYCAAHRDSGLRMPCDLPLEVVITNLRLQTDRSSESLASFVERLLDIEGKEKDQLDASLSQWQSVPSCLK